MSARLLLCGALAATSLTLGRPASADVVYSNFAAAQLGNVAWTLAGSSSPSGYSSVATGFTASGNFSLDSVSVAINGASGCTSFNCTDDFLQISLWTSAGNSLGSELGSWLINQPVNGINTVAASGINLLATNQYFLELAVQSPTASLGWIWNTQNVNAPILFNRNATVCLGCTATLSTNAAGAFELDGTASAVPLPSSLILMISALVGIGVSIRPGSRRRRISV